jgi:hypothetical protein
LGPSFIFAGPMMKVFGEDLGEATLNPDSRRWQQVDYRLPLVATEIPFITTSETCGWT